MCSERELEKRFLPGQICSDIIATPERDDGGIGRSHFHADGQIELRLNTAFGISSLICMLLPDISRTTR